MSRIATPHTIEKQMNKPLVHQKTKKGIILCGSDPNVVQWTHYCALVTCQTCKNLIDAIVDSVFEEL